MTRFVRNANFPECCDTVVYGRKYAGFLEKPLLSAGINSLLIQDNPDVDKRLSGHADLSILHAGGDRFFLAPYLKGSVPARKLADAGAELSVLSMVQGADYPHDAQLNVALVGKYAILNPRTAGREIVEFLTSERFRLVPCRQGYSRCAVCPVDGESLITADRGIAVAAKEAGFSVLLISEGFVSLDGFPYGFLGGAAFKIARNVIAFTGTLDHHPDRERILEFLCVREIEPLYLTDRPIFDIGSAIPVWEKSV